MKTSEIYEAVWPVWNQRLDHLSDEDLRQMKNHLLTAAMAVQNEIGDRGRREEKRHKLQAIRGRA